MFFWIFLVFQILSFELKIFRLFIIAIFYRVFDIEFLLFAYYNIDIAMSTSNEFVFMLNDLDNIYTKRVLNR